MVSKYDKPKGSQLKQKVKTAASRTNSSTRWLQRQLNDPYVLSAKEAGLRSRAAYKLIEINDKFDFLKPGKVVIDLGATPGGWSQVAANLVNSDRKRGRVIAIDINEMEELPDVQFTQLDFLSEGAPEKIIEMAGGTKADIVLSDMASPATGHKQTDHLRIMLLCEEAYSFAKEILKPGGAFVAKILQGGTENELLREMKQLFTKVQHFKPPASRKDSSEIYVIATGFRGNDEE